MKKIEHIGIAVKNIESSNKLFAKIFGKENFKSEVVESEGVLTSFFQIGENKIELVAATNSASPIQKYLEKNREGIHHLALDVEDICSEMERLKKELCHYLKNDDMHFPMFVSFLLMSQYLLQTFYQSAGFSKDYLHKELLAEHFYPVFGI